MMMTLKDVQLVLFKIEFMFFSKIKILISFVIGSVILICLLMCINTTLSNLFAAVLGSIVASMAVSAFYNEELHIVMDKYKRIGLKNYFENFEDVHNEIKEKILKAKNVDIFVMYGDSFLNMSTKSIQSLLSVENSKLRYFIYSSENKFIDAYGNYWGENNNSKYNSDGIKAKIENVKNDLRRIVSDNTIKGTFELYEIKNAPASYSFYRIDNDLYFVPSKNIRAKEIKPPVFHFKKTELDSAMFSKIENELEKMIINQEVIKIEL